MPDDFIIRVHPARNSHRTGGGPGMGDGRYTIGAFVRLREDQEEQPDDDERSSFIDQLLRKHGLQKFIHNQKREVALAS